jgi:uncharacterized membrane-anchored protein
MKPTWSRALMLLGAFAVLATVNLAIVGKERIRRDGITAYLVLAPVDPRSLLQGDYMALRFALAQELERSVAPSGSAPARDGETRRVAVALDARQVARLAAADAAPALMLRYRMRGGHVWLGTNAFFFEEGSAQRFDGARYGEFRVDRDSDEAVLVGLRDAELRPL